MAKRECSVDGCDKLVNRRGLCQAHAWRERKYGDPLGGKARYAECSVEDCHVKHYARGWCAAHYQRWHKYGDPLAGGPTPVAQSGPCSVDGCRRTAVSRTWCLPHYRRWEKHGNPTTGGHVRQPSEDCTVGGCESDPVAKGWCLKHYQRWREFGDPEAPLRRKPDGEGWRGPNNDGYIVIKKRGVTKLEHHLVMEKMLGRKLYPGEEVHHKNTIRDDNDPGNLELWTTSQPAGGRVADIVAWVVRYYPDEVRQALASL
jgi:hypothetical protein